MNIAVFVPLALLVNVACFLAGAILGAPVAYWLYKRTHKGTEPPA